MFSKRTKSLSSLSTRDFTLTRTNETTLRITSDKSVVDTYLWLFRRPDTPWQEEVTLKKDNMQIIVKEQKAGKPTVVDFTIEGLATGHTRLVRTDGFLLKNQACPPLANPSSYHGYPRHRE